LSGSDALSIASVATNLPLKDNFIAENKAHVLKLEIRADLKYILHDVFDETTQGKEAAA
jgi:hypothetical protein